MKATTKATVKRYIDSKVMLSRMLATAQEKARQSSKQPFNGVRISVR